MSRANTTVHQGGIAAAIEFYRQAPTPNLIVVESRSSAGLITELDSLAEVCDAGTKVLAVGHTNDIAFYRELMRRGISEYMLAPVQPFSLVETIAGLYGETTSSKLGRVYAFMGAKGGVGSSTVAHNVAWTIARRVSLDVIIADMDLPFGTAGLDFNVDAGVGIGEAIQDPARLDEVLLDRLLTKCGNNLSLLAAPGTLDRSYDICEGTFERLLEVAQASVPFLILDMPHLWTAWSRNMLKAADEVVLTAAPDLAGLRNTKSLIDFLKQARPNDPPPKLILNQVGMPKRPEIKPRDFAKAVQLELTACIPFDAHQFGTAANNGQMAAEITGKSAAARAFAEVSDVLTGRQPLKGRRTPSFNLSSIFGKPKR
ncbi:AAA family ATPase [Microvirga roseola]|uniref:AAA family ATPase n=1 Tax=Microvirga roseola TaxID=2883126 RepID=UPI001E3FA9F1|nr:CpaE family protein [Microvirga roseola]